MEIKNQKPTNFDEIPLIKILRDPDITITPESPHRVVLEYWGKSPAECLSLIEVVHGDVFPTECRGSFRLKILPSRLNIGIVTCDSCNTPLLVDWEAYALQPYINKLRECCAENIISTPFSN